MFELGMVVGILWAAIVFSAFSAMDQKFGLADKFVAWLDQYADR